MKLLLPASVGSSSFFLYEKLKEAVVLLLQRVAQPMALENSIQKPVKQDFCLDANLLPVPSVRIGFGDADALKKIEINFGCNRN